MLNIVFKVFVQLLVIFYRRICFLFSYYGFENVDGLLEFLAVVEVVNDSCPYVFCFPKCRTVPRLKCSDKV